MSSTAHLNKATAAPIRNGVLLELRVRLALHEKQKGVRLPQVDFVSEAVIREMARQKLPQLPG